MLGRHFTHVRLLSQRPMLGSVLLDEAGAAAPAFTVDRLGPNRFQRTGGLARAIYLVAMASDAPLPALPSSAFVETDEIGHLLNRAAMVDDLAARLAAATARAELAEAKANAIRAALARLQDEVAA